MAQFLLGMTLAQLEGVCTAAGMKRFVAKQLADWLYKKRVASIDQMTNLSKENRARLSAEYEVGHMKPAEVMTSRDGTRKYAFEAVRPGQYIETVMIPESDRATLCVSSQAGCKMGCTFCMTGRQGFHGNLTAREIIAQFMDVDEAEELTNAVFMGMGEPLDNWDNVKSAIEILTSEWGFGWSPKRITLSSVGVMPNLRRYLDESRCHLAISLHDPFADERGSLMPVEKAWPVADVVRLIRQYDFSGQRRVSFEYIMFAGLNDSKRHEDALIRMLRGLECRVNLIRFHKIPDFSYESSATPVMEAFRDRLNAHGITCTIRASRGEDILAACGMLAGQHA